MNDLALSRWIATHAHNGQTRWDNNTPYITHPEAVASYFKSTKYQCVAWLHDVVEDTEMTLQDLRDTGLSNEIVQAVDAITKREGEEYVDYLNRVINNDLAAVVKIADIKHNLTNLKKGSMRDKYLLAISYIQALNNRAAGIFRSETE